MNNAAAEQNRPTEAADDAQAEGLEAPGAVAVLSADVIAGDREGMDSMKRDEERLTDLLRLRRAAEDAGDADDRFVREIGRQIAEENKRHERLRRRR